MADKEFQLEHDLRANARGVQVLLANAVAFEDIRRNRVDAYPGWLIRLVFFFVF